MKLLVAVTLVMCLGLAPVFADQVHEQMKGSMKIEEQGDGDFGICPVMGGEASSEYSYEYEGKTYYFCCPSCIEAFVDDPGKYISETEEEVEADSAE